MFTYIRTQTQPNLIGTSRTVAVPTSPATHLVSLSGFMGWQLVNVGAGAIAYGDSSVAAGTGALLFYSMEKTWYPLADTMSLFVRADSVASALLINYYR